MKNLIYILLTSSCLGFCASCNSNKNQTPEEMVDNLIKVLIENDFEKFRDFVLTKDEIIKSMKAVGGDISPEKINEKWKAANENTNALFKRFYRQKTNWAEVIVDSLQYDIMEKNELKATEVMIYYSLENKSCKLRLRRLSKIGNGGWKLANYPSFFTCVNKK